MAGNYDAAEHLRENLQAELTEAALEVASRHGVRGPSVDQELELWHALGRVVRDRQPAGAAPAAGRARGAGLVAELTETAYRIALGHGFRGSFLDLEMDLWEALCRAVRDSAFLANRSGNRPAAREPRGCDCPAPSSAWRQPALA